MADSTDGFWWEYHRRRRLAKVLGIERSRKCSLFSRIYFRGSVCLLSTLRQGNVMYTGSCVKVSADSIKAQCMKDLRDDISDIVEGRQRSQAAAAALCDRLAGHVRLQRAVDNA